MDVVDERLNVRKRWCCRDRTAIRIKGRHPAGVDIDVLEAVLLQAGGCESIGLRLNVGLSKEITIDGLLAEGAPTEIRFFAYVVDLRLQGQR